ncbi:hypothetical protein [Streptomyces sp. NPDC050388]|uniref:hypothetical protein n=1 Tax=Streptomyces sp. NPDC050388 TaxID=3155781 RepID=UPI003438FCE5
MTAQQSSTAPVGPRGDGEDQFPAGTQVFVRDEVWLVRNSARTEHDGAKVDVVGVSDFVRDQEAVFFTGLDRIELIDPRRTRLVRDESSNFRRSRLFLDAVLRKTALPQSERRPALTVLVPDPEASAASPSTT